MPDWATLPLLVDLILVGMICEAAWLVWRHNRSRLSGLPPFVLHVASGFLLLLAMKLILQDADLKVTAGILGLAGICHLFDLKTGGGFALAHHKHSNSDQHHIKK